MTKESDEPLLANHPNSPIRQAILDKILDSLRELSPSDVQMEALSLAGGMSPAATLQSWVLLRDKVHSLDARLESRVRSECEQVHLDILGAVRTDADVIPPLHSICSRFMEADDLCINSWKKVLHDVIDRFDESIILDEEIKDYIVNMTKFGSWPDDTWPEDDMFVNVIQEMYVRHGHYGAICDICEEILDFEPEDARYARYFAHIEASIAAIADDAIAKNISDDRELARRCAGILKRRAEDIKVDILLPRDDELTFQAVAELARSLLPDRKSQNPSPWLSKYTTNYPFMYEEFEKWARQLDSPLSPTIETGWNGLTMLARANSALLYARFSNARLLRETLATMMANVREDVPFGEDLQRYVTDMAKSGSGASGELARQILLDLCVGREMYVEVCNMCEKMNEFRGADARRMVALMLIESVAGEILQRVGHASSPSESDVVRRCVALFEARGAGLKTADLPGDIFREAGLLGADIGRRRRARKPPEICSWIRDHYPSSYAFLNLGRRGGDMMASKSTLATHVSDAMDIHDMAGAHNGGHIPSRVLDRLEAFLYAMEGVGLDPSANSGQWKKDIRGADPWGALLEMGIYTHCKAKLDVEARPKIGGGRLADLRVGGCHIETYAPQDAFIAVTGHVSRNSVQRLCRKIMGRSQVGLFGKHESMLVVECNQDTFGDSYFRKLLEEKVQNHRSLGGVLLVLRQDDHYETFFARNRRANTPVPEGTLKDICDALETSV